MRLGVLGGTFDPPHIAHLVFAQSATEQLGLDLLLFVPAGLPPFKQTSVVADANHRLEMTRLATNGNKQFIVSDIELKRAGVSYTVDTIRELREIYGNQTEIVLLLGSDCAAGITTWYQSEKLLRMTSIAIAERPGENGNYDSSILLNDDIGAHSVAIVKMPYLNVSSTMLRQFLREKRSVRYLVSDDVIGYIKRHSLYDNC
jgi:nicotinate-nucleotide adenylyltransferase